MQSSANDTAMEVVPVHVLYTLLYAPYIVHTCTPYTVIWYIAPDIVHTSTLHAVICTGYYAYLYSTRCYMDRILCIPVLYTLFSNIDEEIESNLLINNQIHSHSTRTNNQMSTSRMNRS